MGPLRELRLLLGRDGELRTIAKLVFTGNDTSIYAIPYAASGVFHYGQAGLAENQVSGSFAYSSEPTPDLAAVPKLSMHESGQVHAGHRTDRAGPLRIPPLVDLRGQHIASILTDALDSLPTYTGPVRSDGAYREMVVPTSPTVTGAALAMYVNGAEPTFAANCPAIVWITRNSGKPPLHIGLRPRSQPPLDHGNAAGGVTVIAGWDPTAAAPSDPIEFVYIRGS